jgi:signal transduction histidine kinase
MSGDELMHALRTHPELDATPIVMLTAKADDELRVKLLREGAQDHLTKPFSVEELRVRVENLIARKRAEAEILKLNERLHDLASASLIASAAVAGLPGRSVDAVLHTIALQAQALTHAELVAVGLGTDPTRPFEPWVTIGISAERAAAIGHPPRPVGTLGHVARRNETIRIGDVRRHPAFEGLPPNHPDLGSFLGVPIRFLGQSVGNLYLANKRGAAEFTNEDQQIVEMLAARAGVALETARLYRDEGAARVWLESVIDQMTEGVVLLDVRGHAVAHSRSMLAMAWGDTGERDPFDNPIMLDLRYPSGQRVPVVERPSLRALLRGETTSGVDLLLRNRDGGLTPVLVSAAPVRGRAGEVTGATMIVQDITHRKELERLREEWAAVIAHDMRQPVGVITFAAASLAKRREGGLAEDECRLIERIRGAGAMLSRMITDLLDASSLEAKRLSIRRSNVDLPGLIAEVVARTPAVAERCEVTVDAGVSRGVSADPERIAQVLDNLLSNAVKYGKPDLPIRVQVTVHDDAQEVIITNQGRGIRADELPLLFSRFARSRETRTGRVPGLGLGLYICKGLIEAHEGRIWAESTPGETTSFHFTLPRAVSTGDPPDPLPREARTGP